MEGVPAPLESVESQRIPGPLAPWRVLHTKPRQEKALLEQLHGLGIWAFLPLAATVRYYGRRKARVSIPLFPGYVFMRGELEDAYQADRTGRVVSLVRVPDQEQLERELWGIWRVLEAGATPEPCPSPEKGTFVEVLAGPFAGVRGVVDQERAPDRLVLRVDLIGGAADLEIERALLSSVD